MATAKLRETWRELKRLKGQKDPVFARLDAEIANHRATIAEDHAEMELITQGCLGETFVGAHERDIVEKYNRLKAQKDPVLARLGAEIADRKATLAQEYAAIESLILADDIAEHQAEGQKNRNRSGGARQNPLKRKIVELRSKHPRALSVCRALDTLLERNLKEYKPLGSWQRKADGKRSWVDLFDDKRTHNAVKTFINKVEPSPY